MLNPDLIDRRTASTAYAFMAALRKINVSDRMNSFLVYIHEMLMCGSLVYFNLEFSRYYDVSGYIQNIYVNTSTCDIIIYFDNGDSFTLLEEHISKMVHTRECDEFEIGDDYTQPSWFLEEEQKVAGSRQLYVNVFSIDPITHRKPLKLEDAMNILSVCNFIPNRVVAEFASLTACLYKTSPISKMLKYISRIYRSGCPLNDHFSHITVGMGGIYIHFNCNRPPIYISGEYEEVYDEMTDETHHYSLFIASEYEEYEYAKTEKRFADLMYELKDIYFVPSYSM